MAARRSLPMTTCDHSCRVTRLARVARTVRFATVSACLTSVAATRQPTTDPLSGNWALNVARTHYGGGAEPRQRETFRCTRTDNGVDCTIESQRADGHNVVGGFSAAYDGTPGPTRGIPDVDHVQLIKVNASIADATFTWRGKSVFAYRAVRSGDARSLTIISVDPVTRTVLNSVVVYDRR